MTARKGFKRHVRDRARGTGESYTAAGLLRPDLPEAEHQNAAVSSALAVTAMGFAQDGYTAVVSGYVFPEGVTGLAVACGQRSTADGVTREGSGSS